MPAGRLAQFVNEPVAGTFAWTSPDTMTIKVCAVETPFHQTYTLKLTGETVTIKAQANVGFGPTTRGPWIGRSTTRRWVSSKASSHSWGARQKRVDAVRSVLSDQDRRIDIVCARVDPTKACDLSSTDQ